MSYLVGSEDARGASQGQSTGVGQVSEDIFKEVQAIEAEAERIAHEAHRQCEEIRRETAEKAGQLGEEREKAFAGRKEGVKAGAEVKLQAELAELKKTFAAEKARLEKAGREQTEALAGRVVERFGKAER